MKKETLVRIIDEEFGDEQPMSWLIDVYLRAFKKNDDRITQATKEYITQSNYVRDMLSEMIDRLKEMEKEELENGVRILHKRNKEKE